VHRQKATRVEYSLTSYGTTLAPILRLMAAWGEKHKKVRLQRIERRATKG
jgi:DNA-binding HxlR family transcriptional regulator